MLLPCAVKAAMEETLTMTDVEGLWALDFSSGASARTVAKGPRTLVIRIWSKSASVS
jgi:hypothetical protein